jgi:hypothetical protein
MLRVTRDLSDGEKPSVAPSQIIKEGDLVILYNDFKTITYTRVASGQTHNNKFGAFRHKVSATAFTERVDTRWPMPLSI